MVLSEERVDSKRGCDKEKRKHRLTKSGEPNRKKDGCCPDHNGEQSTPTLSCPQPEETENEDDPVKGHEELGEMTCEVVDFVKLVEMPQEEAV